MSSKSSILLTKDSEHWYHETNESHYDEQNRFIGFTIVLEFSKKNIEIFLNDDDDLALELKPGSELYQIFNSIKK